MKILILAFLLVGCSALPVQLTTREKYDAGSQFEGTIVQQCAPVTNGCQFGIAISDQKNIREIFVPWGTNLYNQASESGIYTRVKVDAIDRGDGIFVLRSLKEVS